MILVNAVFAYVQEYRAEQAVAALRRMLPIRVRVRRDGGAVEIPNEDVVPGDVLLLAPGDRVAGDAGLLASGDLRVDESTLTGESSLVAPAEWVFAGTYVTAGNGEALVTATGMATRLGRIAELAQRTRRERSPLERELDRLTRVVALIAVSIGVLFVLLAGFAGMSVGDRFVLAIGVTVALVPDGLLPTVTLSLALATQRMAKRNALVRRLSSVETLGETTVICTDKTGTLTENQMTVERVWGFGGELTVEGAGYEPFGRFRSGSDVADPAPLRELLRAGLLCNEGALVVLAEKGGLRHEQEAAQAPRLSELPFSSESKRMTTVHRVAGERVAYVKGAAEQVLPRTTLSAEARAEAVAAEQAMEGDALRVLAMARRVLPADCAEPDEIERDLEFLGLVGMLDPPRPEVPEAIQRCRQAGIRIVMVTGDSGRTAEAIARAIGLGRGGGPRDRGGRARRHRRRRAAWPPRRARGHLRPHRPRAEAPPGPRPARGAGGGGDDRRRRQRRAGPEAGRHRHRDGQRDRGREGGGRPDPDRRQLRLGGGGRGGGEGDLRQHPPLCLGRAVRGAGRDGELPLRLLARRLAALGGPGRLRDPLQGGDDDDHGGDRDGPGWRRPQLADQPRRCSARAHARQCIGVVPRARRRRQGRGGGVAGAGRPRRSRRRPVDVVPGHHPARGDARHRGDRRPLRQVACRDESLVVAEDQDVSELLERPAFARVGRAVVSTADGRLGLLSITDVNRLLRALELAGEDQAPSVART